jgi:tetratricopeptide (TPR) repeat protein
LELRPGDIDALRRRAWCYRDLDEHGKALEDIHAVAEQVKTDPTVYTTRGFLLIESEQHKDAIADAEKALELDPKFVYAYALKAAALANLERWDEAIAALDQGSAIDAKDTNITELRAQVNEHLGPPPLAAASGWCGKPTWWRRRR